MTRKPEILAPAGDTQSFLAAMAAGADAVYLGLKHFSARMQADNFGSAELSRMVELANENGRRIYVAFNTLVKPDDVPAAGRLIARLARDVKPHGLIIQDPGVLALARQAGYEGGLFLSTLANLTHPASLLAATVLLTSCDDAALRGWNKVFGDDKKARQADAATDRAPAKPAIASRKPERAPDVSAPAIGTAPPPAPLPVPTAERKDWPMAPTTIVHP